MISPGDNFRIVYESHPSTQNHTHRQTHNQYDNCPSFKVSCCARQTCAGWSGWDGWSGWCQIRCQAMTDVSTRDAVCSWGWCFAHWSTRAFHAVWVFSNNINCHNNNKINKNTCHAEVKDKKNNNNWRHLYHLPKLAMVCKTICLSTKSMQSLMCLSHRSV